MFETRKEKKESIKYILQEGLEFLNWADSYSVNKILWLNQFSLEGLN